MKGTPVDGMIQKLFMGKMKNYIKCVNVDFESSMMEDFYGELCVGFPFRARILIQSCLLLSRHPADRQRNEDAAGLVQGLRPGRNS
jgi:hypothetical protein